MSAEMLMQIKITFIAAAVGFGGSYVERLNQNDSDYSKQLSRIESKIEGQSEQISTIASLVEKQDGYGRQTAQDVAELRGKFSQLEKLASK